MKAMIFAAGLGTRLRPITDTVPKALVPIKGEPILSRIIKRIIDAGGTEIIINTHYHAEQMGHFIKNTNFGVPITTLYEPEILETARSLQKAKVLLKDTEPILVHNGDVLSDINLKDLYVTHVKENNFATLATRKPGNSRPLLIHNGSIVGYRNKIKGEELVFRNVETYEEQTFCGIHVLSQDFLSAMGEFHEKGKSIIHLEFELIKKGYEIRTFDTSKSAWFDIGNEEKLKNAEDWAKTHLN